MFAGVFAGGCLKQIHESHVFLAIWLDLSTSTWEATDVLSDQQFLVAEGSTAIKPQLRSNSRGTFQPFFPGIRIFLEISGHPG